MYPEPFEPANVANANPRAWFMLPTSVVRLSYVSFDTRQREYKIR